MSGPPPSSFPESRVRTAPGTRESGFPGTPPAGPGSWLPFALAVAIVLPFAPGCAHRADPPPPTAAAEPLPADPEPPPDPAASALEAWEVFATRRIQDHWNSLLRENALDGPPGGGRVEIECEVEPSGQLLRAEVRETTVDRVLTRMCLRSVRDPSPFAPLPPGPGGEPAAGRHGWRITFAYEHRKARSRSHD